ncbi:MAG: hypothetical protein Q8S00_14410 [Deltaproteobacteria bacterium]|nr:hypothetical protein [Deltaproteobacteria bacterium]
MFESLLSKVTSLFRTVADVAKQRRERKRAVAAEMERRERTALVQALVIKLEAARVECEQKKKSATAVVLSVKEIQFIEWNLAAWERHIKTSEIYAASRK